jgi:aspartate kinase
MSITVQKYGGTSLADSERVKAVAHRICKSFNNGGKVLAVVSAQSGMTDMLTQKIKEVCNDPHKRESDVVLSTGELISIGLLSIAINNLGVKALSLNSFQAGIFTEGEFTKSKILQINIEKIIKNFEYYDVIIIPGFQGVNENNEITTLGRGGSDITAVALTVSLKLREVEIYTDVDGVYTADPRIIDNPFKINELSYQEMLEMAGSGSKVLHSRSVELASKNEIKIKLLSSFNYNYGTEIKKEELCVEKPAIRAISNTKNESKITIFGISKDPKNIAYIFEEISKENINIDVIVQDLENNKSNISFTLSKEDFEETFEIVKRICKPLNAVDIVGNKNVAKVSLIGVGMKSNPGVAAKVFKTLAEKNIDILMISCSEIKISCIINEKDMENATIELHKNFFENKKIEGEFK